MKTIALAFVVASTLLIPTISHANAALLRCMDRNGKLAEQILASNLIVVGTVDDVDENTTRKGDHWTATWTAKLRVQKTVHGTPPPKALSLSGQCSGLKNMSHNHCGQTPSKSDKATLIFLNKDKEGHYHLVSPPRHTGHGDECPDAKTVAKLEKKMPGLFAKVTKAQEELEKEAATAKLAAKDKELAAKNKELAAKNKELATKNKELATKNTAPKTVKTKKGLCSVSSSPEFPWSLFGILGTFIALGAYRRRSRA